MPFAFITSRLPFPQLNSTLPSKFEAHDGAMLHKPIINCWRRIVNQAPDFHCRTAAQFNNDAASNRRYAGQLDDFMKFDCQDCIWESRSAAVAELKRSAL